MTLLARIACRAERDTINFAHRIAPLLRAGDILLLSGPLGAGKSALARGIIHALGYTGDVPSPTFNLLLSYDDAAMGVAAVHADLYRLEKPQDYFALGLDDLAETSIILIEWSERLPHSPADALAISISIAADMGTRLIELSGGAVWQTRLAAAGINLED